MAEYPKADFFEPAEFTMRSCSKCESLTARLAAAEAALEERTLQHRVQLDNAVSLTARLAAVEALTKSVSQQAENFKREWHLRGLDIEALRQRLAEAEASIQSMVADLKAANDGKVIAETAAIFLVEGLKHVDQFRYQQALRHWPFLSEAMNRLEGLR